MGIEQHTTQATPLSRFIYPYVVEAVPVHDWTVDGRLIRLSRGWRLQREPPDLASGAEDGPTSCG